jgi:histidyl-tRNA synthetase
MQKAASSGARFAVILGDDELARDEASLKDLASGEQRPVAIHALAEVVRTV